MPYTDGYERKTRLALGQIRGVNSLNITGYRFGLGAFDDVTVWDGPTDKYYFTDPSLARINRISSDDSLDTGTPILIEGLDENWNQVTQTVILDGQNKVSLPVDLIRVNRAASLQKDLKGNVYIYEDVSITLGVPDDLSKVRGFIDQETNISQALVFSVPAGYAINIIQSSYFGIPTAACCLKFFNMIRYFEGALLAGFQGPITQGESQIRIKPESVAFVPEKSDIYVRLTSTTAGGGASGALEFELIKV
jgi:hypothetical protein